MRLAMIIIAATTISLTLAAADAWACEAPKSAPCAEADARPAAKAGERLDAFNCNRGMSNRGCGSPVEDDPSPPTKPKKAKKDIAPGGCPPHGCNRLKVY